MTNDILTDDEKGADMIVGGGSMSEIPTNSEAKTLADIRKQLGDTNE